MQHRWKVELGQRWIDTAGLTWLWQIYRLATSEETRASDPSWPSSICKRQLLAS